MSTCREFFFVVLRKKRRAKKTRLSLPPPSPPHAFPPLLPLPSSSFHSYGPLGEVLPYLLRRALENSQMLSASSSSSSSGGEAGKKPSSELDAVRRELKARAVAVFFPRDK